MSPIWCQRWPNIPENIGKNEADGAKTAPSCSANQKLGLHTLHAPPHTPLGQSYINSLRCSSGFCIKNWVCTRSMPPPHPPPVGQSYINSLRCSSGFCIKNWVCTRSMPPPTPPVGQSYINSLRCSSGFCIKNWVCTRSIPPPTPPP